MICEEKEDNECCGKCEEHWWVSENSRCLCTECGWEL